MMKSIIKFESMGFLKFDNTKMESISVSIKFQKSKRSKIVLSSANFLIK